MLVDDDDSLRGALVRMIRMAGFDVQAFCSVEALLASGLPEHDACLVLDVVLPGMSGIEFRRSLAAAGRNRPGAASLEIPDEANVRKPAIVGAVQRVRNLRDDRPCRNERRGTGEAGAEPRR